MVILHVPPNPVAERYKSRVCGRSLAGILVLNPAGGLSLVIVVCVVRYRSVQRADHSPRRVLPTVVCHFV